MLGEGFGGDAACRSCLHPADGIARVGARGERPARAGSLEGDSLPKQAHNAHHRASYGATPCPEQREGAGTFAPRSRSALPSDRYGLDGRDESQPLMVREVALLADRSLTPDP
jgi:hypothetical protein